MKSDMSVDFGFEDVDSSNVKECLDSHSQPLTHMNLIELKPQGASDKSVEIASEGEGCVSKEILVKELEQMFRNLVTVNTKLWI
jgi:hypothetical protein